MKSLFQSFQMFNSQLVNKKVLSRRDFLKMVGIGVGLSMASCLPKQLWVEEKLLNPTATPARNPTGTPVASETPTPSPTPTMRETPIPDDLTLEKIKFLAAHPIRHGQLNEKITIMTYDEGVIARNVEKLLDVYQRYHFRSTFFMTGYGLNQSASLLQRIVDEEHIIGCHSWDHTEMTALKDADIKSQFDRWFTKLDELLPGYKTRYWRSPYGSVNQRIHNFAASYGLQHVGWNVESGGVTDKSYDYVFRNFDIYCQEYQAIGGAIVLSHTQRYYDISQAEKIIQRWVDLGYNLVTIDDGISTDDRWPPTNS